MTEACEVQIKLKKFNLLDALRSKDFGQFRRLQIFLCIVKVDPSKYFREKSSTPQKRSRGGMENRKRNMVRYRCKNGHMATIQGNTTSSNTCILFETPATCQNKGACQQNDLVWFGL